MRSFLLLLLVCAVSASAQPGQESPATPLAQAQALIAAGRDADAYRTIGRALNDAPEDTALLTLRLELQQRGVGLFGRPPFARRIARRRLADTLLRLDSTSATAHDEIGRQRLEDYLFDRDFIRVGDGFSDVGMSHGSVLRRNDRRRLPGATREVAFNRGGRYDLARLRSTFPILGKPGMAEDLVDARRALSSAFRHGGSQYAWPLARLLIAEGDSDALLALADETQNNLLRGAALYRLGRTPEASGAFEAAMQAMSEEQRRDMNDPARVRPHITPKDAERFWREQDVLLLTASNERLTEHHARIVEADRLYGWETEPGRNTTRGQIYIRYGVPDVRATLSEPLYPGDAHVTSGGDLLASPRFVVWEYASGLRYVFMDNVWNGDYAIYAPSALAFSADVTADADDYIEQDERLTKDMPDASQFAPPSPWPLVMQVTRFKGENGQIDLVVASVVTVGDSPPDSVATGVFALRGGAPEAQVTSRQKLTPQSASGGEWSFTEQISVQPGEITLAAEAVSGESLAGWARETDVARAFGSGLQLSGVLLATNLDEGRAPEAGEIARRGSVVRPSPEARFPAGDPIAVYAEVYGLNVRNGLSRYTVEASLVPTNRRGGIFRAIGGLFRGGGQRGVSVTINATSPTPEASIPLYLDPTGQEPGTYTLTMTVEDLASGETARSRREVELIGEE